MKKDPQPVTAANSKTMNAVEKVNLYAASEEKENGPDFTGGTDDRFAGKQEGVKPKKSRTKKNNS